MGKTKELVVGREDKNYPPLLKEIAEPPARLYAKGTLPSFKEIAVAIVGTRKATEAGRALARHLAEDLSRRGIIIVSGLAMGIDAAAHQGALEGGTPTVAVLAGGVDSCPRLNDRLAEKIIETGGALISEEPVGTDVQKYHFLRRNRIVSGLSRAVIIIEAPAKSGALVTARLAAESGREVLVFPGPVAHPNYKGSHALIRDGARLVASTNDILEDLGLDSAPLQEKKIQSFFAAGNEDQSLIIRAIVDAGAPLSIDKIVETTKLTPQIVITNITLLVLNQSIKETEKGYAL